MFGIISSNPCEAVKVVLRHLLAMRHEQHLLLHPLTAFQLLKGSFPTGSVAFGLTIHQQTLPWWMKE